MLNGIVKVASSTLPVARVSFCLAAGYLVGRKASQATAAIGCKMGSKVAELLEKNQTAAKLSASGDRYMALAKNHLARDLTLATGLVAMGLATESSEDALVPFKARLDADESNAWDTLKGTAISIQRAV